MESIINCHEIMASMETMGSIIVIKSMASMRENDWVFGKIFHRFHDCMVKLESMVDCYGKHGIYGIFPFPLKNKK
jgi:hypothetical protein